MILREYFVAESSDGPFLMKYNNVWNIVPKNMWYDEIHKHVEQYYRSLSQPLPSNKTISFATQFLHNKNATKYMRFGYDRNHMDKLSHWRISTT